MMFAIGLSDIITNGLSIGIAFFLAAAGLTILFGILRMLNFAHGSFLMVGAYLTSTILGYLPGYGLAGFLLVAIVVGAAVGLMGLIVDRVVFRRLHGLDEAVALIATFALMLVVDGVVELIWGARYVSVDVPRGLEGGLILGSLIMPWFSVLLLVVGLITFLLIDIFLHRSWIGKTLLAIAEDRWIMGILGHSPRRLELLAVFMAFFLAGFAGSVLVPNQILTPSLGSHLIIQAFAVVVVGGLGSVRGAFLAAMLLGIAESIGSVIMPSLSLYIGMILILILRPQGLIAPKLAMKPGTWSFSWLWQGWRASPRPLIMERSRDVPTQLEQVAVPVTVRAAGHAALHPAALAVLVAFLVSLAFWASGGVVFVAGLVLIATVFALSWNLMFGFGGIASFGHAAFFAIGAYLSAYVLKSSPNAPFLLILAGAFLLGGAVALPVGIIALRRATGVQLAILTLALAEVLRVLISYTAGLGRDEGLSAVPRPRVGFGELSIHLATDQYYYLFLCLACSLMVLAIWGISHSGFGRILRSIRQDAQRAMFLGVNVDRIRLMSFVLAAAIAAFAGALSAPLSQIVTPAAASIERSTEPMLNTLLGGAGSFWGPAIGATIFAAIEYGTRTLAGLSEFIMGITLLVVVLIAPGGVASLFKRIWNSLFGARVTKLKGKPVAEEWG
jgi:branched-chain amino acid transport system permease protein